MSRPYFFLSLQCFIHPSSPICPVFFFLSFFLSSCGMEKTRQGEIGKGEGRGRWVFWGQRTNESGVFFTKVEEQTARNATHRYQRLLSLPESSCLLPHGQAFIVATSLCTHTNAHIHFFSVYNFPTVFSPHSPSASLHPIMSSLLSLLSDFPHSHVWQRLNHRLGERKLPFHSIRLTAPQTLSICSLILSLFHLDQIWMHSLMCDTAKISVYTGCQNHTERETWPFRDDLTCTNWETHTHTHQMHPDRVSGPFVLLPLLQAE